MIRHIDSCYRSSHSPCAAETFFLNSLPEEADAANQKLEALSNMSTAEDLRGKALERLEAIERTLQDPKDGMFSPGDSFHSAVKNMMKWKLTLRGLLLGLIARRPAHRTTLHYSHRRSRRPRSPETKPNDVLMANSTAPNNGLDSIAHPTHSKRLCSHWIWYNRMQCNQSTLGTPNSTILDSHST